MLLAGQIGKPHGTSGEVYVIRISDDPHRFDVGAELIHEDGRTLVVASARPHRDRFLVRFEGIDDRPSADLARGRLYIRQEDARDLEEDEFWPHDLVGCEVLDPDGAPLGTVSGVQLGGVQDLLVLDTPRGERLVPLVQAIVTDIDLVARTAVVDAPPGLLD
jgi:16S rRNA processing protein RimM